MAHFSLTAIGVDQPGIVAALSGVLVEEGCNLEDSTMSILRGHFAVLLVISAPEGVDAERLEESLALVAAEKQLVVAVRPLVETAEPAPGAPPLRAGEGPEGPSQRVGSTYTLSVHGADRPGIVYQVANSLAEVGGNIVGLLTRLIGDPDRPVYVMVLTVSFPPGVDGDAATQHVSDAAAELGVQCRVQPADADVL